MLLAIWRMSHALMAAIITSTRSSYSDEFIHILQLAQLRPDCSITEIGKHVIQIMARQSEQSTHVVMMYVQGLLRATAVDIAGRVKSFDIHLAPPLARSED